MDNIPPEELKGLVDRLTQYVKLGRTYSPKEIRDRIRKKAKFYREVTRRAKRQSTVKRYQKKYKFLKHVDNHDIHRRIWNEAANNPGGEIDLTLDYGADNAKKILTARRERQLGKLKKLRGGRRRK